MKGSIDGTLRITHTYRLFSPREEVCVRMKGPGAVIYVRGVVADVGVT